MGSWTRAFCPVTNTGPDLRPFSGGRPEYGRADSEWRHGDLHGVPGHGPGLALGSGGAGVPGSAVAAAAVVFAGAAAKAACAAWARLARGAGEAGSVVCCTLATSDAVGTLITTLPRRVDAVAAVAGRAAGAARSAVVAGTASAGRRTLPQGASHRRR